MQKKNLSIYISFFLLSMIIIIMIIKEICKLFALIKVLKIFKNFFKKNNYEIKKNKRND